MGGRVLQREREAGGFRVGAAPSPRLPVSPSPRGPLGLYPLFDEDETWVAGHARRRERERGRGERGRKRAFNIYASQPNPAPTPVSKGRRLAHLPTMASDSAEVFEPRHGTRSNLTPLYRRVSGSGVGGGVDVRATMRDDVEGLLLTAARGVHPAAAPDHTLLHPHGRALVRRGSPSCTAACVWVA